MSLLLLLGVIESSNGWFNLLLKSSTARFSQTLYHTGEATPEVIPLKELFLLKLGGTNWVNNMLRHFNSTQAGMFTTWRLKMSPTRLSKHGQRLGTQTHLVQAVCIDVRAYSGIPLDKFFNSVLGEITVGAVGKAEVPLRPDETTIVSRGTINQPRVAASNY